MTVKALYWAGLLVVGGALCLMVSDAWIAETSFKEELVKTGLQVLVFGIAGGGVTWLVDRQRQQRELRADLLARLGQAHKDVYRVRRLLTLAADSAERAKLLGELMDARQDLGGASHSARVWDLGGRRIEVQKTMQGMRDYLKTVIDGALASDDHPDKAVYVDFLAREGECKTYLASFKNPYLRAKQLVDPTFVRVRKR